MGERLQFNRASVRLITLSLIVSLCVTIFLSMQAGAVSWFGPDVPVADAGSMADGDRNQTRYSVEHTPTTDSADQLRIPIYIREQPTNVITYEVYDFNRPAGSTKGVSFNGGPHIASSQFFSIDPSQFTFDTTYRLWRANVVAQLQDPTSGYGDNNWVRFRIQLHPVHRTSAWVGVGGEGAYINIGDRSFPANSPVSRYDIPLATPCSITSNTTRTISLRDLDHRNTDNNFNPVTVEVYNQFGALILTRNGDSSANMGQNETFSFSHTFEPGQRYTLRIRGVVPKNVLQVRLPFDSINDAVRCDTLPWSVQGESYINANGSGKHQGTIDAKVGDTLRWAHDIRNRGPADMNRDINYRIDIHNLPGDYASRTPTGSGRGIYNQLFVNLNSPTVANGLRYQVQPSDAGKLICQRIVWSPVNSSAAAGSWGWPTSGVGVGAAPNHQGFACARIAESYTLTPSVNTDIGVVEPGASVNKVGRITNTGTTSSDPTKTRWESRVIYGATIANSGTAAAQFSAQDPCTFFARTGGGSCDTNGSGNNMTISSAGFTQPLSVMIADRPVGTRVCISMSVKDRSSDSTQWAHAIRCGVIGKSPKVQIHGGDVIVGRAIPGGVSSAINTSSKIETSLTAKMAGTYGSWVEYSALAPSRVINFASGAGLSGDGVSGNQGDWSKLTYANMPSGSTTACNSTSNRFGCYAPSKATTMPAISAAFDNSWTGADIPTGTINFSSIAKNRVARASGDFTLQSGNLALGQWLVVYAPGRTVTIAGNLNYVNAPLTSASQIPQLIIIAGNINIQASVTKVDAWLIASGSINTCSDVATTARLSSTLCANQLRVNGPVLANTLYLRRTAGSGSGTASGDPAETFNLRADAYIWASNNPVGTAILRSTQYLELPPRF